MMKRPITSRLDAQEVADTAALFGIDPNGPPFLTVREVCTLLNQRRQYVYDRIAEGELLAHRRPGVRWAQLHIVRTSVIAYLAKRSGGVTGREYEDTLVFLFKRLPAANRRSALQRLQDATL